MRFVIQRWVDGRWLEVAEFRTKPEATVAEQALNAHMVWEYRIRTRP